MQFAHGLRESTHNHDGLFCPFRGWLYEGWALPLWLWKSDPAPFEHVNYRDWNSQ